MTELTIDVPDTQYQTLEAMAKALGVTVEGLLLVGSIESAAKLKRVLTAHDRPVKKATYEATTWAGHYLQAMKAAKRHMDPTGNWRNSWALELELLKRNRKVSYEEILEILKWALKDEFWGEKIGGPAWMNLKSRNGEWRIDMLKCQMLEDRDRLEKNRKVRRGLT